MFLLAPALVVAIVLGACSKSTTKDGAASGPTTTNSAGAAATSSTAAGSITTTSAAGPTTTTAAENRVIQINIVGGSAEGGVRRETVKQNEQVTVRVTSDVADELHIHTYDLKTNLVPGQSADITFVAKIAGVFEVELEKRAKKVLELEVRP
jgi:uncharacterized cupredoxin-like copper-binding protein